MPIGTDFNAYFCPFGRLKLDGDLTFGSKLAYAEPALASLTKAALKSSGRLTSARLRRRQEPTPGLTPAPKTPKPSASRSPIQGRALSRQGYRVWAGEAPSWRRSAGAPDGYTEWRRRPRKWGHSPSVRECISKPHRRPPMASGASPNRLRSSVALLRSWPTLILPYADGARATTSRSGMCGSGHQLRLRCREVAQRSDAPPVAVAKRPSMNVPNGEDPMRAIDGQGGYPWSVE